MGSSKKTFNSSTTARTLNNHNIPTMAHFNAIFLVIAAFALMQINALPLAVDEEGNGYYLVPIETVEESHVRARRAAQDDKKKPGWERETLYDFSNSHAGLGQKLTFENDKHKFSASATAGRDYRPKGPLTTTQGAEYIHKPSGSTFDINTSNTRGQGTDLSAAGTYNFFQTQDKRGRVGISGEYSRHYGGPFGTSKPNYGVFVRGRYDF